MKQITIITSEHCAPCKQAKGFLKSFSIPFAELDIELLDGTVSSIPTIFCKENTIIKHEFTGFSLAIGNRIKSWFDKED